MPLVVGVNVPSVISTPFTLTVMLPSVMLVMLIVIVSPTCTTPISDMINVAKGSLLEASIEAEEIILFEGSKKSIKTII